MTGIMDPELKAAWLAAWLAALRSGKYPQGQRKLGKLLPDGTTEYCCLSVLCEINRDRLTAAGIETTWRDSAIAGRRYLRVDFSDNYPADEVCEALGLGYGFWKLDIATRDGSDAYLDSLNDNGFTFAQIADVIENQL